MSSVRETRTPAGDPAWLVSDYDTVKELLLDPRLGGSHPDPASASRNSESVIFGRPQPATPTEATEHTRMRRLLSPWFSARRMELLRPRVSQLVEELLEELAGRPRPVDFHEVVSVPLPVLVICEILGVPFADRADTKIACWSVTGRGSTSLAIPTRIWASATGRGSVSGRRWPAWSCSGCSPRWWSASRGRGSRYRSPG